MNRSILVGLVNGGFIATLVVISVAAEFGTDRVGWMGYIVPAVIFGTIVGVFSGLMHELYVKPRDKETEQEEQRRRELRAPDMDWSSQQDKSKPDADQPADPE